MKDGGRKAACGGAGAEDDADDADDDDDKNADGKDVDDIDIDDDANAEGTDAGIDADIADAPAPPEGEECG